MPSRLEVINRALFATENQPVAVEFDNSDEWAVAFSAYERNMPLVLNRGRFNFSTTTAALTRLGDAPAELSGQWVNRFALPADAMHITSVTYDGIPVEYRVFDGAILTKLDEVAAVYVRDPGVGNWPTLLVESLTMLVEAGLLRSFGEHDAARAREKEAWAMFDDAAVRSDQQQPGRVFFSSRIAARRRFGRGR